MSVYFFTIFSLGFSIYNASSTRALDGSLCKTSACFHCPHSLSIGLPSSQVQVNQQNRNNRTDNQGVS